MRISAKPVQAYPLYLRPFFWNQKRKYGAVLDAALLWARAPKLFLGVALLYGMIDRRSSPIDPALRSLVTVRVSQINDCPFCVDINSATLLKRGVAMEKVEVLEHWRTSDQFDARERAALDYAEAITDSTRQVDDALVDRLRGYFDEDAIIELTGLIAFQNMSSRFNSALAVPAQGFCLLPDRAGAAREEAVERAARGGTIEGPAWQSEQIRQLITGLSEKSTAAFNRGDYAACAEQYAEDALMLLPDRPPIKGRKEIQDTLAAIAVDSGKLLPVELKEVVTSETMACCAGVCRFEQRTESGESRIEACKFVTVFLRQGDGSWKAVVDTFFPDTSNPDRRPS